METMRRWPHQALLVTIVLMLLAVPLVIWHGVIDYNLGKAAVLLAFLPFATFFWGLAVRSDGDPRLRLPSILIPFALFGVAGLLSLVGAVNRPEAIQALLIGGLFVQLLFLLVQTVDHERDAELLIGALLVAGSAAGVIALLQYTGLLVNAVGRTGPAAVISTFGNRNYLGAFLACLVFPAGALILRGGSIVRRVVAGILIAFLLAILLLVDQMATPFALLAGGLVGMLLVLIAAGAKRKRIAKGPLLLFLIVAVVAASVIAVRIWPRTTEDRSSMEQLLEENSIDSRLLFWSVGWEMFTEHPLTGIGLGNYRMLYTPYEAAVRSSRDANLFPEARTRTEVAHNDYVQIVAELGIGGLVAMIVLLAVLGRIVWVRLFASRDAPEQLTWILFLAAGLAVFLADALVSFPVRLPTSALVGIVSLALLFSPIAGERGTSRVRVSRGAWRGILLGMLGLATAGALLAVTEVAGHALMQRGAIQLSGGDPDAAHETLVRSVRLRFSPRCSVYYLATAQAQLGRYDEALANFERCFRCCTADHTYLFYADLASQLGDIDAARTAIDILLATAPPEDMRRRAEAVREQIDGLSSDDGSAPDP